jgi:hypothetical protein
MHNGPQSLLDFHALERQVSLPVSQSKWWRRFESHRLLLHMCHGSTANQLFGHLSAVLSLVIWPYPKPNSGTGSNDRETKLLLDATAFFRRRSGLHLHSIAHKFLSHGVICIGSLMLLLARFLPQAPDGLANEHCATGMNVPIVNAMQACHVCSLTV